MSVQFFGVDPQIIRNNGWQPIETAPKDGTPILGYDARWHDSPVSVIVWCGEWRDWSETHPFRSATHWQPLPDPPK